jgi:hypothetical protein
MVGTAVTALTAGAAGIEGAMAGVAAAGAGSSGGAAAGTSPAQHCGLCTSAHRSRRAGTNPRRRNRSHCSLFRKQRLWAPRVASDLEGHADQIRSSISDVMGADNSSEESGGALAVPAEGSGVRKASPAVATAKPNAGSRSSASARRGPSVHRYNLGTWSAYHAARIAARSMAGAAKNQD